MPPPPPPQLQVKVQASTAAAAAATASEHSCCPRCVLTLAPSLTSPLTTFVHADFRDSPESRDQTSWLEKVMVTINRSKQWFLWQKANKWINEPTAVYSCCRDQTSTWHWCCINNLSICRWHASCWYTIMYFFYKIVTTRVVIVIPGYLTLDAPRTANCPYKYSKISNYKVFAPSICS